ncbi:MAG: hypothetical protein QOH68_3848, partial [Nocardioidaceae bacterium]|nr:hypothetical protein [Nocardioidaceae bacterium]
QTDAAFNTAAGSSVILVNGAQSANVVWVATGAAGTGAASTLAGSILARGAITIGAGTSVQGQVLSLGTVTLESNALTGITPAPAARRAMTVASPEPSAAGAAVDEPALSSSTEETTTPPSPAEGSFGPEPKVAQ